MTVDQQIELHELAVDAIEKWRSRAAADHHAEPKTALERLCRDYCDIEDEIARGVDQQIGTFEDDLIALEDEMDEPGDPDEE